MYFLALFFSTIGALFCAAVQGQAPNTLQGMYPNDRTASFNGTFMLVPVSKTAVQAALPSNYSLLDVSNYASELPHGFEDGKHPVLVVSGDGAHIQMQALGVGLSIPFLLEGLIYIPFVDRLGDGKTPFLYPVIQILGGDNGQLLASTVPTLVGSADGTVPYPGSFNPDAAAYNAVDPINNPGLFTSSGNVEIVSNTLSGPSVFSDPLYQNSFHPTADSPYTAHTFHSIVNQPEIIDTGECVRNVMYFDNPYADPWMTNGTVTLYSGTLLDTLKVGLPQDFAGTYEDVFGFAATVENVALAPQNCADAAASVDPAAST